MLMELIAGTSLPGPSGERIRWFDKAYRVTLPSELVRVLKIGNGAVPVANAFDQGGRQRLLERLLCILERPQDDAVNGWADITVVMSQIDARLLDDMNLIGMNVIPFGMLFGGDMLCLDFRTKNTPPAVVVWDHELSEEFRPHLEKIADSFGQFETMLRKP